MGNKGYIELKVEAREMNESVKAQFMRLPGLPTHGPIATPSANPNNSTLNSKCLGHAPVAPRCNVFIVVMTIFLRPAPKLQNVRVFC